MEIVSDKKINEHIDDRVVCSKIIFIRFGCLETVHINNQTIIQFVNLCPKSVPDNISFTSIINQINGYLDTRISTSSIRYIIKIDKRINYQKNIIKRSQRGDINRLLKKNLRKNG